MNVTKKLTIRNIMLTSIECNHRQWQQEKNLDKKNERWQPDYLRESVVAASISIRHFHAHFTVYGKCNYFVWKTGPSSFFFFFGPSSEGPVLRLFSFFLSCSIECHRILFSSNMAAPTVQRYSKFGTMIGQFGDKMHHNVYFKPTSVKKAQNFYNIIGQY